MSKEYDSSINEIIDTDMEVICIDNKDFEQLLTLGKNYKVFSHMPEGYSSIRVIDDFNKYSSFYKSRFIVIADIRDYKLTLLGI